MNAMLYTFSKMCFFFFIQLAVNADYFIWYYGSPLDLLVIPVLNQGHFNFFILIE